MSFKTALPAGNMTPYSSAVVIDMGVFGPDGLSERNMTYTGKAVTNSLSPGEHTTIARLVADQANYDFVVHPGGLYFTRERIKYLS